MSLFADDVERSSTGELEHLDSVMIAFDDLRIVNSKLIELEYEKQINAKLKEVISNDSIVINKQADINAQLNSSCKKYLKQRNICFGAGITAIIFTLLFSILK